LNKVAYCRATKRALYLFLGAPEPRALDARHDDLPWLDCREPPGNTLHIGKTLAFLALFHGPEPDSALYLDADAWLSDSAFAGDASPEALAPDAQFFGNQNQVWVSARRHGHRIIVNGGTLLARRGAWTSRFFALWWRGRCGSYDQLPLWATLFGRGPRRWTERMRSTRAATGVSRRSRRFSTYADARCPHEQGCVSAVHMLTHTGESLRAAAGLQDAYDGGTFWNTSRLDAPLSLPHVFLLPSARFRDLPALTSDIDSSGTTFICHTRHDFYLPYDRRARRPG